MKTLITIIAITFTLFSPAANAQAKLINDSTADTNVTITNNELKFEKGANGASLSWQTANECHTSRFELQLSYDNKSFETIKTVAAGGVTESPANYIIKFRKTYVSAEKVYYRLKTVFTNATEGFTFSSAFQVAIDNGVSYASLH